MVATLPGPEGNSGLIASSYSVVFSLVPRVVVAGWIALWCGEMSNNYVLARLKDMTDGRHFWFRALASTFVRQGINTTLFYTIGLGGLMSPQIMVEAIAAAWVFKLGVEALCLPLTIRFLGWIRDQEAECSVRGNSEVSKVVGLVAHQERCIR